MARYGKSRNFIHGAVSYLSAYISCGVICSKQVYEAMQAAEMESSSAQQQIISKEHPAFTHYHIVKDARDWMAPQVQGYYPGFFNYWKKVSKY